MLYAPGSVFTLDTMNQQISTSIQGLENQLNQTLNYISANPAGVSQAQLVVFQANIQLWSNMIQLESSAIKVYGDTMKQTVTNMAG